VRTRPDVALYVLNQKRAHLRGLEERFVITITITADESLHAPQTFMIDRGEQVHTIEAAKALAERAQAVAVPLEEEDDLEDFAAVEDEEAEPETETAHVDAASPGAPPEQGEGGPRGRRRRRGGRGRNGGDHQNGQPHDQQHHQQPHSDDQPAMADAADEFAAEAEHEIPAEDELAEQPAGGAPQEHREHGEPRHDGERRRRRGRRGGRRNRQRNGDRGPTEQRDFAPAGEPGAPPSTEPTLREAVADLDAAPPAARAPMRPETPPTPVAQPEPVRRRSTVRERAPVGGGEEAPAPVQTASPAPEPVVETSEAADTDRPRKTGWWSRRFAGG
jgi:ribonuclease E